MNIHIITRYERLVDKYKKQLKVIDKPDNIMGFASHDCFTLEPFYEKINNLTEKEQKLYKTQEELPENSKLFAFIIQDKELVQVREFLADKVYVDSLFINEGGFRWRYMVFIDGDKVSPRKIERILRNNEGGFKCYESYNGAYYQRYDYLYKNDSIEVFCKNYDGGKVISDHSLYIDTRDDQVNTITRTYKDKSSIVYDFKIAQLSIEDLLESAKKYMIDAVMLALKQETIKEEILVVLFEYNCQTPLPPSVALGQSKEMQAVRKEEDCSLLFYNAPDLYYFSEEDNLTVDFEEKGGAVFASLNKKLLEMYEDEGLQEVCFNFYLDLSRTLKRKSSLKKLISVHDDFHVTARDFDTCNEWEFLQALLPQKQIHSIQKELDYSTCL